MIDNNSKREKVEFPEGKIVLLDGKELECFHKADATVNVVDASDDMTIDTTGQYLSIGKKKPVQPPIEEQKVAQKELFVNNAFYLLAHKDRILSDSRMFLCPIAVQSGLAYTGTSGFRNPTLGVYIEWWLNCHGAMRIDGNGLKSLVYHLAGSPLSGANKCSEMREDGKTSIVSLSSFGRHWGPFTNINTRYTDAKARYQAYTLEQVLDILHQEDGGDVDCAHVIETLFLKNEINKLNEQVSQLKKDRDEWCQRYYDVLFTSNDARIREFYAEYQALKTRVDLETIHLKEQKQNLKVELKSGRMDNVSYQKQITPINKRIRELKFELCVFAGDKLKEIFHKNNISLSMIEEYIEKHKNEDNEGRPESSL